MKPLGLNRPPGSSPVAAARASSSHLAHCARREPGSRSRPAGTSTRPSSTATRTASVQSTQESPASGSAWVRLATRRADRAPRTRSSRAESADHGGAHQGTVAGTVGMLDGVLLGRVEHHPGTPGGAVEQGSQRAPQHRRCLQTYVGRVVGHPDQEVRGDRVDPVWRGEVDTSGGDVGDAHRHRGVVAPLAGLEVAEAAAEHLGGLTEVRWQRELVRHSECITRRLAEQHACGPVTLRFVQVHGHPRYC